MTDDLDARHAALVATPWRDRVDARHFIPGPPSWSNTAAEGSYLTAEGSAGAFRSDDASEGRKGLIGDPDRFHEAAWAEEV